jgi:hypothetical protein
MTAPVRVTLWPLMNWLIVRMGSSFLNVCEAETGPWEQLLKQ